VSTNARFPLPGLLRLVEIAAPALSVMPAWAAHMTGIVQSMPTALNELQISRLFKCAVKDDETLIDTIVERLYRKMKEFDGRQTDRTVGLIVDRDAMAGATLRAFLDDVLLDPRVRAAA
jgi:hypothetical protein